jgi:hypothetical protein
VQLDRTTDWEMLRLSSERYEEMAKTEIDRSMGAGLPCEWRCPKPARVWVDTADGQYAACEDHAPRERPVHCEPDLFGRDIFSRS